METLPLAEASRCIKPGTTFLCCSSFEARSSSIISVLQRRADVNIVLFKNRETLSITSESRAVLRNLFEGRLREVEISKRDALFTADVFASEFERFAGSVPLCIDLTTFTREAIFLLI